MFEIGDRVQINDAGREHLEEHWCDRAPFPLAGCVVSQTSGAPEGSYLGSVRLVNGEDKLIGWVNEEHISLLPSPSEDDGPEQDGGNPPDSGPSRLVLSAAERALWQATSAAMAEVQRRYAEQVGAIRQRFFATLAEDHPGLTFGDQVHQLQGGEFYVEVQDV